MSKACLEFLTVATATTAKAINDVKRTRRPNCSRIEIRIASSCGNVDCDPMSDPEMQVALPRYDICCVQHARRSASQSASRFLSKKCLNIRPLFQGTWPVWVHWKETYGLYHDSDGGKRTRLGVSVHVFLLSALGGFKEWNNHGERMNIQVQKEKETAEKRIKRTCEMIEIPANQHSSMSEVVTVRTLVVCRM